MLWTLVLFGFAWLTSAADKSCALELEQALFKPKSCGIEYFEKMACQLNYQIPRSVHFGGAVAAEFCLRFSKENQVALSILNAAGMNLCTLNNPNANAMAQIPRELSYRSRTDRYTIYEYFNSVSTDPVPINISGPADPDLDSIGLTYIYNMLQYQVQADYPYNAIPAIETCLKYIRGFTNSGPKSIMDLNMNEQLALITASVPLDQTASFLSSVLNYLSNGQMPVPSTDEFGSLTVIFLFYVLVYNTFTRVELPPLLRLANYTNTQNYMMTLTGAGGIAKSFAQPLPINVYNDGLCSYAYNLFLNQGSLFRVVFSQTDLLFKKK